MNSQPPAKKFEEGFLQRRHEFNVGPFHIYAGEQVHPHTKLAVGHSHEQPHLMVMLNPKLDKCPHCQGQLPTPNYVVRATTPQGEETILHLGPFDLAYVRAGTQHSIEQTTEGALGGFACIFPRYDENGKKLESPRRKAEPGVDYGQTNR